MNAVRTNPKEDLQAIREIMERSSKFLSLSGLAGIFAGVCALTGVALTWYFLLNGGKLPLEDLLRNPNASSNSAIMQYLALDAMLVMVVAFLGAILFSHRKAMKAGQHLWTISTRRLLFHFMIPLAAGGLFVLILLVQDYLVLAPSATLVFYGLALVNGGKFTFGEIHYLGLTQIVLGIIAGFFVGYGLLLWTLGFGLMHIVYGTVMYFRHEKNG